LRHLPQTFFQFCRFKLDNAFGAARVDPNLFGQFEARFKNSVRQTGIICDDAKWVADVTVPDGTEMTPGQDFVKTWKIRNTGSCTWGTGYTVIYAFGEKMSGIAEPLNGAVAPNEEVEVSVRFKAPSNTGEFASTWRMANASNVPFGENIFVLIVVR